MKLDGPTALLLWTNKRLAASQKNLLRWRRLAIRCSEWGQTPN